MISRPFYKGFAWQALSHWGEESQLDMATEEFAELIVEINRYKRGRNTRVNIIEEMADCYLMLDQLREIFLVKGNELGEVRRRKLVRLTTLIDIENSKATQQGGDK